MGLFYFKSCLRIYNITLILNAKYMIYAFVFFGILVFSFNCLLLNSNLVIVIEHVNVIFGRYFPDLSLLNPATQKEMKIISLHCLLVNWISSSWRGCLDEMPLPNVFPGLGSRCNYSPGFSLRSDAALGKHKEFREHPWTLSVRGHWYSNNTRGPFDCAATRAFQFHHLHMAFYPFSFSKV
jgi:hypothetical protein